MDLLIKCNVGPRERLARMALGVGASIGAYLAPNRALKVGLGALGVAGIATSMTRYCPINQLLGVDHCQPAVRSVKQLLRRL